MEMFNPNQLDHKWAAVTATTAFGIPDTYSIEFYKTREDGRIAVKAYKKFGWSGYLCKVHTREDGSIFFEKSH